MYKLLLFIFIFSKYKYSAFITENHLFILPHFFLSNWMFYCDPLTRTNALFFLAHWQIHRTLWDKLLAGYYILPGCSSVPSAQCLTLSQRYQRGLPQLSWYRGNFGRIQVPSAQRKHCSSGSVRSVSNTEINKIMKYKWQIELNYRVCLFSTLTN